MGGSQSDNELFVQAIEQWKHNKTTIRAPHQLDIHKKKGDCIYCRIVRHKLEKSIYFFVSRLTLFTSKSGTQECCHHFRGYT